MYILYMMGWKLIRIYDGGHRHNICKLHGSLLAIMENFNFLSYISVAKRCHSIFTFSEIYSAPQGLKNVHINVSQNYTYTYSRLSRTWFCTNEDTVPSSACSLQLHTWIIPVSIWTLNCCGYKKILTHHFPFVICLYFTRMLVTAYFA